MIVDFISSFLCIRTFAIDTLDMRLEPLLCDDTTCIFTAVPTAALAYRKVSSRVLNVVLSARRWQCNNDQSAIRKGPRISCESKDLDGRGSENWREIGNKDALIGCFGK